MLVKSFFFHQFGVRSFLNYSTLIENKNTIGVFDSRNAMANDKRGLVFG
jgi:hypothetical protein